MSLVSETPRLWLLFFLQLFCALFFLSDTVLDITGLEQIAEQAAGAKDSDIVEYIVSFALIIGAVLTGFEIKKLLDRQKKMSDQIKIASGAFVELMEQHFNEWSLTKSERDVAVLAIKGLSMTEIASVRETKEGTVKAQCNAIYKKAGVTGRQQLLSLFIEELIV